MVNSREVDELHPALKRGAEELKRRLKAKGWNMGISATYRDNEYQDKLYSQGRTTAGSKVTNAKGGQSIHNYRLAFDIFNNVPGNLYPEDFMKSAGEIWEDMGGEWGGSWTSFKDKPHMQFTNGLSLKDLQQGENLGTKVEMKWEKDSMNVGKLESKMVFDGDTKVEVELDALSLKDNRYYAIRDIINNLNKSFGTSFKVEWDSKTQTSIIRG